MVLLTVFALKLALAGLVAVALLNSRRGREWRAARANADAAHPAAVRTPASAAPMRWAAAAGAVLAAEAAVILVVAALP